ncbi:MAG: phage portal protein [Pseudomonadota bacterium]
MSLRADCRSLGRTVENLDPGTFGVLPKGYQFQSFDPDYPHAQYEMFVKACLRGIASGLNVAYTALANDLQGVNFSSIRAGVLEERDQWMLLQHWFAEAFLTPVFEEWLALALLSGEIRTPSGAALPAAKLDKFRPHAWQGRRWAWVDPVKDIEASIRAIQAGLADPYTVAAQMGLDLEEVVASLAQANRLAEGAGLPPYVPVGGVAPAADPADEEKV